MDMFLFKGKLKKHSILSIFAIIFSSFMFVYSQYSLSHLLDLSDLKTFNSKAFIIKFLYISLIWIVSLIIFYVKERILSKTFIHINVEIQSIITEKIISLDTEEFLKKDTGNYISWYTNDAKQISLKQYENMFDLISSIFTTVFSFIAIISFDLWLGVFAIALNLIMIISPVLLKEKIQDMTLKHSNVLEKYEEGLKEYLSGYLILKAFNKKNYFHSKIKNISMEAEKSRHEYSKVNISVQSLIIATSFFSQMILLVITIYFTFIGRVMLGAILAIGNLSSSFFQSAAEASQLLIEYTSVNKVKSKFEKDFLSKSDNGKLINNLNRIDIKDLNFSYDGTNNILSNINMNFEKGKKYAIVGASGGGKSTLAKIISGWLKGYKGDVLLDGQNANELSEYSINNNVMYIQQDNYLFSETIKENLLFDDKYNDEEILEALKSVQLESFVSSLPNNIETKILENGKNISGGQKQRFALARAILRNINFLIVDEGTSSLDKKTAYEIEKILLKLPNIGVIFITHHLNDEIKKDLDAIYSI